MFESLDLWLLRAMYAGGSDASWLQLVRFVTFLGSGWMLLGLVPLLFLTRMRGQTMTLLVTLAATSGIVASAKALAGRVRPCNALEWAQALPIDFPTDSSFPSGHAAGSFAFAAFVFASHRRAGLAIAAAATLVASSRVALGVHYPSDVAAGALVGAALGWIGARLVATVGGLPDADSEPVRQ
jgi:undecaprenyl-diphosphatase